MRFVLQVANADAGGLLEELLQAAEGATSGGGLFAWTTAAGAAALFTADSMTEFLSSGSFVCVVGVDQVTDSKAVSFLVEQQSKFKGLMIKAFLHDERALFHPKVCWFANEFRTTLIVGSGNLTIGGLRRNWEAYTVHELSPSEGSAAIRDIMNWIETNSSDLVPIDDPSVLAAAAANAGMEPRPKRRSPRGKTSAAEPATDRGILVAEIPKSGDRWNQANFNRATYEGYFGAKVGSQRWILFYQVKDDGSVGMVESRPSVAVKSRNYRFELSAAKGYDYPTEGRPIGVFRRVGAGEFLYSLELPGTNAHLKLSNFLSEQSPSSRREMRRLLVTEDELSKVLPQYPLMQADLPPH